MISPFTINPNPENNKAKTAVAILGTLGGVIFLVSMQIARYQGLVALAAMMLIVAALTVSVKYILSEFTYEITESDGEWLFVVGQRSGKRYTTLCRVGLASVVSIEKKKRGEKDDDGLYFADQRLANAFLRRNLIHKEHQRYFYLPTMMPDFYYVMTVENRYEEAKIALQLTDGMADLLRTYAEEARLLAPNDDEEE